MRVLISDPLFLSHFPLFCIAGTIHINDPPLGSGGLKSASQKRTRFEGFTPSGYVSKTWGGDNSFLLCKSQPLQATYDYTKAKVAIFGRGPNFF